MPDQDNPCAPEDSGAALQVIIEHIAAAGLRRMQTADLLAEVEYVRCELADMKRPSYPSKRPGAATHKAYIIQRGQYLKQELDRRLLLMKQGDTPTVPIDFIRRVRDTIDISDVFGRLLGISFYPSNANRIKYACPAHSDKHPSGVLFMTQPQHYHCFQCQANGDCFDALMAFKGMTFIQAVDTCAAFLGWSMPEKKKPKPRVPITPPRRGFYR